jgi:2,4-dienoyl-CoA reductase-like NADH-dependent reductase (Old Yellow Enzyme family)
MMDIHSHTEVLFRPLRIGSLNLPNRIVMAPMTRGASPGGVPGANVAAYYRRRAEGGVGLIFTEGTWPSADTALYDAHIPCFFGKEALAGWAEVVRQVHGAGGRIIPQLWHIGLAPKSDLQEVYGGRPDTRPDPIGPSGLVNAGDPHGRAMTQQDIDQVSEAYVAAAVSAFDLGFDGIELHAAHGYLIDEFFWGDTNQRPDRYGGDISERTRFGADIVKGIRAKTSPSFPIVLRYSQWKLQDFTARPWPTPQALEKFLAPMVDAGVDIFDCSQRRFWTAEFEGSELNLAGWTRKLSGKPTISVGSVTLGEEFIETLLAGLPGPISGIGPLLERMERGEFDLIAVGRALIANPDWAQKIRANQLAQLRPFSKNMLADLI